MTLSPSTADRSVDSALRLTDRRAALVAGLALLLMAVVSAVAILGTVDPVVTADDVATELRDAGDSFRVAVLGLVVIALLDLLVAWALWRLFEPVDRHLAVLAGGTRAAYACIYLVAIGHLATAVGTADPDAVEAQVATYQRLWDLGLLLFGLHLALIGWLCWRSGVVPRVIGALVALAGLGYVVDGVGVLLSASYDADLASFLFIGEVTLLGWLIWWGARGRTHTVAEAGASAGTG